MNMLFLERYINKITIKDIKMLAIKNNINLNEDELNTLYYYAKNKYKDFLKDPLSILMELKGKISNDNYLKIYDIYNKNKEKIRSYFP